MNSDGIQPPHEDLPYLDEVWESVEPKKSETVQGVEAFATVVTFTVVGLVAIIVVSALILGITAIWRLIL